MKSCNIQYNKNENTIKFNCNSTELLPAYLHYLLMYHKLPETAIMIFQDKSVKLIKTNKEYKFERI